MGDYDAMIQDIAAAFNKRDFSRARGWMHDDAVFDWSRSISDNRGIHQGRDRGIEISGRGAQVWDLREGKISRVPLFQSRKEAEAALGHGLG
jgi:hypothetical protein